MTMIQKICWTLGFGLCFLWLAGCSKATEPAPIPHERYLAEELFLAGFRETHLTVYTLCSTLIHADGPEDMLVLRGQNSMALERASFDRFQYHLTESWHREEGELLLPEALQDAFARYYTTYFDLLNQLQALAEHEEVCPPALLDAAEILLETLGEEVPVSLRQGLATEPEEQARCNDYLNEVSAAMQKVLDEIPVFEEASP